MHARSSSATETLARVALALALLASACGRPPAGDEVAIFAAASLRDFVTEVAGEWERESGVRATLNFAGSDALARQIEAAGVADVFLAADARWASTLEERGRIVPGSAREVLSNRLVVIAREDAPATIERVEDLARAEYAWLVLADPDAVPAGRYARAWLESIPAGEGSLWESVRERVAPALDVRAALALVEAEPRAVGIVYRTDAASSAKVQVLAESAEGEPRIAYVGALVRGGANPDAGAAFLAHLAGPAAREVAQRHGFAAVPR